jgi:membrane protein DedA with SNARE-associated domain
LHPPPGIGHRQVRDDPGSGRVNDPTLNPAYLIGMFGLVAAGAVAPFLPTGAAVSAAAALAEKGNPVLVVAVVAIGAAGAYVDDLVTYGALRFESRRLARRPNWLTRWLHKPREAKALERVEDRIRRHTLRTLVLSRLVPGGQTPVQLAAAIGGYRWRRYAVADIAAVMLWSVVYTATGLVGRAVFANPWEGVAAGIALVVLISLASNLWGRRRNRAVDSPS